MAEIILTPDAEATLQNLIEVLYKKEYFGFKDSCHDNDNILLRYSFTVSITVCGRSAISFNGLKPVAITWAVPPGL